MSCHNKIVDLIEFQMMKKMDEIDTNNLYHFPILNTETLPDLSVRVTTKFGGIDLSKLNYGYLDYRKFLLGFKNVFEGVCLMEDNDFLHLDLKPENILFEDYSFKIIDFGISIFGFSKPSHQKETFFQLVEKNVYILWSLEVNKFTGKECERVAQMYIESMKRYSWTSCLFKNKQWIEEWIEAIKENYKTVDIHAIHRKIDVFTLGTTLLYISWRLPIDRSDVIDELRDLGLRMMEPYTDKRIDIHKAKVEYEKFCDRL